MTIEERLDRIEQLTLLAAKDALNMDDAAAYTGLSKSYLYKLVSNRQIPCYKSGGGKHTYFAKKELCDWILKYRIRTIEELEQEAAAYVINHPISEQRRRKLKR